MLALLMQSAEEQLILECTFQKKKKKIVGRSYRGKIKKRRKERRKDGRKGEEGKTVRGKGEVALPASHLLAQRLGKQFAPLI